MTEKQLQTIMNGIVIVIIIILFIAIFALLIENAEMVAEIKRLNFVINLWENNARFK